MTNGTDQDSVKWVHLSDFHTGKDEFAQREINSHILSEIGNMIDRAEKPDLIFITGDIANLGKSTEYEIFNNSFLSPLIDLLGLDYMSKIFLVPGNHDVDRSKAKCVDRHTVLDNVSNFLDPTPDGYEERRYLLERFKAFDEFNWPLDQTRWVSSNQGAYVSTLTVGNVSVGVACLNTAWFSGGNDDQWRMTPGIEIFENAIREISQADIKIVIGHHPPSWLLSAVETRFLTGLGKCRAIYLHGHLHKNHYRSIAVTSNASLVFQSGCAFETRDDELWATRFLVGKISESDGNIQITAKKWNSNLREWVLDTDAFSNDFRVKGEDWWAFPQNTQRKERPAAQAPSTYKQSASAAPGGWVLVDAEFLDERTSRCTEEKIIQYFNGRIPQWSDVLSGYIPEREIVDNIIQLLRNSVEAKASTLCLLLGAGGEGKSTAFLQIVARLVQENIATVFWRYDPDETLPQSFINSLDGDRCYIFCTDEANSLIRDVEKIVTSPNRRDNLHFFLASRDTDWIESQGYNISWAQLISYGERRMSGLSEIDAVKIINAWTRFGEKGLGKLADSTKEEAVELLLEAARLEASSTSGAFLGAMLRVKVGAALKDHVGTLLARLESIKIPNTNAVSLLEAFAFIAIPHAENILFLSKPVLSRVLSLDDSRIRRHVINPLGEEAAVANGSLILTRHRAIAEAASEILLGKYDYNLDEILCDLIRAALLANEEGAIVPHLRDWRYLSGKYFENGNQILGIALGETAVKSDPHNVFLIVKLAQLYRQADAPERGAKLFRSAIGSADGNRAFYTEWATCERSLSNSAFSVWLNALSLADGVELRPPDVRDVGYGLIGLLVGFVTLYESYGNINFLKAAVAAQLLAESVTLHFSAYGELEKVKEKIATLGGDPSRVRSGVIRAIANGVALAHAQVEVELHSSMPNIDDVKFEWLKGMSRMESRRL